MHKEHRKKGIKADIFCFMFQIFIVIIIIIFEKWYCSYIIFFH